MSANASLLALPATTTADMYSQRMLPESSMLLALFRGQRPLTEPLTRRRKPTGKPTTTSCLRKTSAYNGGYCIVDTSEDSSTTPSSICDAVHDRANAGLSRSAKKRLSFADQHGGPLVLEREFNVLDAPIFCNQAISDSGAAQAASAALAHHHQRAALSDTQTTGSSVMERLLRGSLLSSTSGRGGGGGGGRERERGRELKSGWSQPELLSLCVLSCSVLGCVVFGLTRQMQTQTAN